MRRTVEILLNLIEELNSKIKGLESENQRLRDENNRLKGEQGKPDIKAQNKKGLQGNHSSEKERQTPKKHSKSSKNQSLKIDREEIRLVSPRACHQLEARSFIRQEIQPSDFLATKAHEILTES